MISFLYIILVLAFTIVGTVSIILYYVFVQKPEIKREAKVNRKKILNFLRDLQRITVEKIAKALDIEEFTVTDTLLELSKSKLLSGILVFPDLYFDYQFCLQVINEIRAKQSSNQIPLKVLAEKYGTSVHNTHKIVLELITSKLLQGTLDSKTNLLLLQQTSIVGRTPLCPFCSSPINPTSSECPACHATLKKCGVCNLIIGNEDYEECPYCDQASHTDHLLEWLKVKGKCPVCKHELHEFELT